MKSPHTEIGLLSYELGRRPLLSLCLAMVVGLFAYQAYSSTSLVIGLSSTGLLLCLLSLYGHRLHIDRSGRRLSGTISLLLLGITAGALLSAIQTRNIETYGMKKRYETALVQLCSEGEKKGSLYRYQARIQSLENKDHRLKDGAKLLLYLPPPAESGNLAYPMGSQLSTKIHFSPAGILLKHAGSRGFGLYLLSQGYVGSAYGSGVRLVSHDKPSDLRMLALSAKRRLISTLSRLHLRPEEEMALAYMTLGKGQNSRTTEELRKQYNAAGASHLLSVSGFHLGVVAAVVWLLTSSIRCRRWGRWVADLLLLFVAWGFTFLSGMGLPTMRAAMMLSFVVAGRLLGRQTDSLNLLGGSAICLLIYNPYYIYDIGFCLSYTSVFSILLYYPLLLKLLPDLRQPILRYLWSLFALGLSVQPLSLPLSLHFFGKVAALSILTNIPLVLLATLLIPLGLLYMLWAVSGIGIPNFVCEILRHTAMLNGEILRRMEGASLPFWDSRPNMMVVISTWILAVALAMYWHRALALRQSAWQGHIHRYRS